MFSGGGQNSLSSLTGIWTGLQASGTKPNRIADASRSCRKFAFTLAEVLITLGVIGVVAAMTLSTVINKYQKQVTVSKLKKFYTQVKLIETRLVADFGNLDYVTASFYPDGDAVVINKYFLPYLGIAKICEKDCPYKYVDRTGELKDASNYRGFYTKDGVLVFISEYHIGYNWDTTIIWDAYLIDINGSSAPNKLGRDVFIAEFQINNFLRGGAKSSLLMFTPNVGYTCRADRRDGCFAKIVQDGWQIKDDYPWN